MTAISASSDTFSERMMKMSQMPVRSWTERNHVICFSVTSDGTTGEQWIPRLEDKGFEVRVYAKSILESPDFKPTKGVTTQIRVLKGELFFDRERNAHNIRAYAGNRQLQKPNAEVACLIREKFTDKEIEVMGLWYVVAMHEPIRASHGGPELLHVSRDFGGGLYTFYGKPETRFPQAYGFAFAVYKYPRLCSWILGSP